MEPIFKRICKECGRTFHGRSDKQFCDDGCRNQFHNRLNSDANNYVRNVNNILRRNRRILETVIHRGRTYVEREELLASGFDFAYHTRVDYAAEGKMYYCYDFAYSISSSDMVVIKSKPRY